MRFADFAQPGSLQAVLAARRLNDTVSSPMCVSTANAASDGEGEQHDDGEGAVDLGIAD